MAKHRVLKRGSIQSVSDWEDIPDSEKPDTSEYIGIARQVINHNWEQARKAALEDTKKKFGR